MRKALLVLYLVVHLTGFGQDLYVLGTAQDGGFPHIGCQKECLTAHADPTIARNVVALAVVDTVERKWWLFEATPDLPKQLQLFKELTQDRYPFLPEGILITHAHIGHYTGLMFLGREALGAKSQKVHALPKLAEYLSSSGPWSQLVSLKNIQIEKLTENEEVALSPQVQVSPFRVPHRDEFSETAGFTINTSRNRFLFIPDIDKWSKWETDIRAMVDKVDIAFIDASFYADGELPNRSISEVPHPFVTETMDLFKEEKIETKNKIHFIHLNHTNPLLFDQEKRKEVMERGFNLAEQGRKY